jgi:hypothetical protein
MHLEISPRVMQYFVTKRTMFYIDMTRPIECTYIYGPEAIRNNYWAPIDPAHTSVHYLIEEPCCNLSTYYFIFIVY